MVSQARIVDPSPSDVLESDVAPAPDGSASEITTVVIDDGGGRRRSGGGDSAPRQRKATGGVRTRRPSLEKELLETLAFFGISVALINNTDGQIIMEGAPRLAHALNNAGQKSENVHKTLSALTGSLTWAEVIGAFLAIVIPIAANHGALPLNMAAMFGVALEPKQEPTSDDNAEPATGVYGSPEYAGETTDSYAERAAVG